MTPLLSVATLVALTEEARRALGGKSEVSITQFPFKVGRESRSPSLRTTALESRRRRGVAAPVNDVYLIEPVSEAFLLHISREHFAIKCVEDRFVLVDWGSACGTIVAGKPVGGNRTGGRTELKNGDLIIVGTSSSPYVFRFETVLPGARQESATALSSDV